MSFLILFQLFIKEIINLLVDISLRKWYNETQKIIESIREEK